MRPKFLVSRTLHFSATQVLEVEATNVNETIVEGESWEREDAPPAGLHLTHVDVDEFQDEDGVMMHYTCPIVDLPI